MATDMALKLAGIEGESQKDGHTKEIDVLSFSYGATQSGTAHDGMGSTAGKANVQDLSITKFVDKSSPLIFAACVTGSHIAEATLFCRKAGGKALDYFKLNLKQVLVTSVSTGASSGDDRVQETVTLNFSEIKTEYTPQAADGTGQGPVIKGYNVTKGVEI